MYLMGAVIGILFRVLVCNVGALYMTIGAVGYIAVCSMAGSVNLGLATSSSPSGLASCHCFTLGSTALKTFSSCFNECVLCVQIYWHTRIWIL